MEILLLVLLAICLILYVFAVIHWHKASYLTRGEKILWLVVIAFFPLIGSFVFLVMNSKKINRLA